MKLYMQLARVLPSLKSNYVYSYSYGSYVASYASYVYELAMPLCVPKFLHYLVD